MVDATVVASKIAAIRDAVDRVRDGWQRRSLIPVKRLTAQYLTEPGAYVPARRLRERPVLSPARADR